MAPGPNSGVAVPAATAEIEARFWAKVAKTDGCWPWTGAADQHGYGQIRLSGRAGRAWRAHRLAYAWYCDPNLAGLVVRHKCDNPKCVRPEHLDVGTQEDNNGDTRARGRHGQANKTHCKSGHEFTPENTYRYPGRRECRTCRNRRARESHERHHPTQKENS